MSDPVEEPPLHHLPEVLLPVEPHLLRRRKRRRLKVRICTAMKMVDWILTFLQRRRSQTRIWASVSSIRLPVDNFSLYFSMHSNGLRQALSSWAISFDR